MSAARRRAPSARPTALASALLSSAALAACASPGFPPGGPIDKEPPKLVRVSPDTGAVNARPKHVVFQFDEVVSERPQNAADLAGLFFVSPRDGEPDVGWKRNAITVRPSQGFHANTVYTVTMLPGLADLRGNVRKEGAETVFSTGPTIPRSRVGGVVFDWPNGTVAPRPLVEAVTRPDTSVVYVTVGDSAGRFTFPHLAPGNYTVRAGVDQNGNRALDEREAWDSASVALADSARVDLYAFVHDTVGPGISDVAAQDSTTLRVTFDRPLDPTQRLDTSLFALRAADSTRVPLAFVRTAAAYDSARALATGAPLPPAPTPAPAGAARAQAGPPAGVQRRTPTQPVQPVQPVRPVQPPSRQGPPQPRAGAAPPRGDTTTRRAPAEARADSIRRANLPKPARPVPPTQLVIGVERPLLPSARYRLQARDVRGLLGKTRSSERVFTTPPAPSAAAPADSGARRGPRPPTRVVPEPVLPRPRVTSPADSARADSARADSARAPRPAASPGRPPR